MTLTETDQLLLRALSRVNTECCSQKSVVVLRYALLEAGHWNSQVEEALCCSGTEEPIVAQYYLALCKLARETPYAKGAGNLVLPAGPRYTECWITEAGLAMLGALESA